MTLRNVITAMGLVAALAWAGCEGRRIKTPAAQPGALAQENWSAEQVPAAHVVRRDYLLREGDQLEIAYNVGNGQGGPARFGIDDVVTIRFPFEWPLNQTKKVRSDGTLRMALVGAVPASGRTIDEVQDDLTRRYSEYIKNPIVAVSIKESKGKIARLKEVTKVASRGQSLPITVMSDGTVSLPCISGTRAAGRTLAELRGDLNDAYQSLGLDEVKVTVNIGSILPIRVHVLGEVRIPGTLLNRGGEAVKPAEITLLQAIAQAGGYIPGKVDLSKVMLIRHRNLPRPQAAIINLNRLLDNRKRRQLTSEPVLADSSKPCHDVWLEDGDIIYVPTTKVAKRSDYIDYVWTHGIRTAGDFSGSAGDGE